MGLKKIDRDTTVVVIVEEYNSVVLDVQYVYDDPKVDLPA